jgi:hypothetical protein
MAILRQLAYFILALGLTQQQLLTESRIAIITLGLAGRYFRGSDYLRVLQSLPPTLMWVSPPHIRQLCYSSDLKK